MKGRVTVPQNYKPRLGLKETERAIKTIKDCFQDSLARALNLRRVSAPLFVTRKSGINDYLNGVEKPVGFRVKGAGEDVEIIQSLAKWKRAALADYGIKAGEGLYTDMNAIRPDEDLDNLHSIYVDQWDWERILRKGERNLTFLKSIVRKIYGVIKKTERVAHRKYPRLGKPFLPEKIHFIHSEELIERYPKLSPAEREKRICEEKGAVFVIGIGSELSDGKPHDGRAPDYDDWWTETGKGRRGLNGDILVWYPVLKCSLELSSMGIRVDSTSLRAQLKIRGRSRDVRLPYHSRLIRGELPLTIGGGIGQSRLCMFFLRKAHVGEVQSSVWSDKIIRECKRQGIPLL
jgi:aspartate--ammonia ligase